MLDVLALFVVHSSASSTADSLLAPNISGFSTLTDKNCCAADNEAAFRLGAAGESLL